MEITRRTLMICLAIVISVLLFYSGGYKSLCMIALGVLGWHATREKEKKETLTEKRESERIKM